MRQVMWTAIAEPSRRAVLELLVGGEQTVGSISTAVGLSQPAASKHLRVLREAGLVTVRKDAAQRFYDLAPQPFEELDAWLAPYRKRWNHSLDRLGEHLDRNTTNDQKE